MAARPDLSIYVVDQQRWPDLVELFGPSGAQRGCWCMFWRLSSTAFTGNDAEANRATLETAIGKGQPVGLIGYASGAPIAWCALAPRPSYQRIQRSPQLKPEPSEAASESVWSVPCFFIRAGHRRSGIAEVMLNAAVSHLREIGAAAIEGYPMDTDGGRMKGDLHSGTISLFTRAGFKLHHRPPTGRRVVMRKVTSGQ